MYNSPHAGPSSEDALRLYRCLLERDALAPADFAAAFLEPLIAWLQITNSSVDPVACAEAAEEALIGFLANPASYDPERLGVLAFLRMAAQRDLQNLLRKERRHQRNRRDFRVVELGTADGKYLGREDDPSLALQIEEARQQQTLPDDFLQELTDMERRFVERMQQGERRTSAFAVILGVAHLSADTQRREVKRMKDRLKKRLERRGRTHGRST
jgi:hypothetical protein